MLALLVRLHNLARLGQSIDIVAFNGAKDARQSRRSPIYQGRGHMMLHRRKTSASQQRLMLMTTFLFLSAMFMLANAQSSISMRSSNRW